MSHNDSAVRARWVHPYVRKRGRCIDEGKSDHYRQTSWVG